MIKNAFEGVRDENDNVREKIQIVKDQIAAKQVEIDKKLTVYKQEMDKSENNLKMAQLMYRIKKSDYITKFAREDRKIEISSEEEKFAVLYGDEKMDSGDITDTTTSQEKK